MFRKIYKRKYLISLFLGVLFFCAFFLAAFHHHDYGRIIDDCPICNFKVNTSFEILSDFSAIILILVFIRILHIGTYLPPVLRFHSFHIFPTGPPAIL
jgi:hypothetical protein